ncbi:hypothetical protein WDU99_01905 [Microbacterium sp. Mu-80]|uniref:Exo-alpha-sialidase n=1 Tax=Microbacterium bandirmense TaxID=3122050 RepID=A0ABU8L6X0_9MICO
MVLPVGVAKLGTFQGDKGNTGTIAYATAESIPFDQQATAEMVGPESNRGAHFRVPRGEPGLPGGNAIENDAAVAAYVATPTSATHQQLLPVIGGAQAEPITSQAALSGYERTRPAPVDASGGIRMLMRDPTVAGRIWGQHLTGTTRMIGYTDDHGATFVPKSAPPAGYQAGASSIRFGNGYLYLLQVPAGATPSGQVWRSPYPDANGDGIVWSKVFDLATPPEGLVTGGNSTLRSDCLAVDGADVYVVEYSPAGNVSPGPSIYHSRNNGRTWAKAKTFTARHIHAVAVISDVPWVSLGDAGNGWTDRGLHSAHTRTGAAWTKRSLSPETNAGWAGNDLYPINFIPMEVGGAPMIVAESDSRHLVGPLLFSTQGLVGVRPLVPVCQVPPPYFGSMRHLTLTPEGNLIWLQTGEVGDIGDFDCIMIAKGPHFSKAVVAEAIPATSNLFASAGDSVLDGDYVWFGSQRIKRPVFAGQALLQPAPVPSPPVVPEPNALAHQWIADGLADGPLTSWANATGGTALAQSSSTARPSVITDGGKKWVRFDGINDFLQATGIGLTQPATILMRVRLRDHQSQTVGLIAPDGAGFTVLADSNGVVTANGGTNLATPAGQLVNATDTVVAVRFNNTASRVSVGTNAAVSGTVGELGLNSLRVGYAFSGGAGRYAAIDVAELRIYAEPLNEADIQTAITEMLA